MNRFERWLKEHENDPRAQTPKCLEIINERRSFSNAYGRRAADGQMADINATHEANVRRARDVAVGLAAIKDRIESDPLYSAKQAASDAEVLRSEYARLHGELPRLAERLERARAISADPVAYAEAQFERFPLLADRLPGLPPF